MSNLNYMSNQPKFTDFPDELLVKILDYLPFPDFPSLMLTCKKFNQIAHDRTFKMKVRLNWIKKWYLKDGLLYLEADRKRQLKVIYSLLKGNEEITEIYVKSSEKCDLVSRHFVKLFSVFPNLEKVKLSGQKYLTDEIFMSLINNRRLVDFQIVDSTCELGQADFNTHFIMPPAKLVNRYISFSNEKMSMHFNLFRWQAEQLQNIAETV